MEEKLRVGERTFTVASRQLEPGHIAVEVDGAKQEVRVLESGGGFVVVEVGGTVERLASVRTSEGTWVWHRGRARLVRPVPRERPVAAAPGAAASPSRPGVPAGGVTPPTPAVVVAVMVEVGQRVTKGQPVAVVSAMKMQSQLAAPFDGVVKAVNTAAGAKVRPGDVLVQIEPEPGESH